MAKTGLDPLTRPIDMSAEGICPLAANGRNAYLRSADPLTSPCDLWMQSCRPRAGPEFC